MISNKLKSKFKDALFHWKLKADFKKPQQIDFIKQLNSYLVSNIGMVEALTSTREQYAATEIIMRDCTGEVGDLK